jgi:hypothetical protein
MLVCLRIKDREKGEGSAVPQAVAGRLAVTAGDKETQAKRMPCLLSCLPMKAIGDIGISNLL